MTLQAASPAAITTPTLAPELSSEVPKSAQTSSSPESNNLSSSSGSDPAAANGTTPHKTSKKPNGMTSSQRTNGNGTAYLAPPKIQPNESSGYSYRSQGLIRESRRRRPWRKLLWVRQNYPDNYTDVSFLDSLQRNVNVRAYDFWPLVSDSTVIAQHLSTVVIFVTAFVAIIQKEVDPRLVAGTSTFMTVVGWLIWDEWTEEEDIKSRFAMPPKEEEDMQDDGPRLNGRATPKFDGKILSKNQGGQSKKARSRSRSRSRSQSRSRSTPRGTSPNPPGRSPASRKNSQRELNLSIPGSTTELLSPKPISATSASALLSPNFSPSLPNAPSPVTPLTPTSPGLSSLNGYFTLPTPPPPLSRGHRRLSTLKSAVLIYSTLLGLSPILKSLTIETSSDSIWALSSWLFLINILCFDYGLSETEVGSGGEGKAKKNDSSDKLSDPSSTGAQSTANAGAGPGANALSKKLPTSLPTTTAMAASVVLASRLKATSSVFYLLLFSIQIFGLFPLFRRRLRYLSKPGHILLTVLLVLTAGAGLWWILPYQWAVLWFCLIIFGLGGAAYWLMDLQRFKNEIRGPWDPARPVVRRRMD